ncbi:MAG: pyridoxal-phosphate dependent enzyme, partial [Eubacteriales bacterium]|nr:pyridoxal-phosphate dependent enzyme [Eubacteriales bacterium]
QAESRITYLTDYCGSSIYIKRDDLIPFSFGGNKVRIAEEIFKEIKKGGYTSVISYGSAGSNMNRAVAAMAKREGIKCYVVIKLEGEAESADGSDTIVSASEEQKVRKWHKLPANEKLVRIAGAEVIYCRGNNVRECVEGVIALSEGRGEKPYYIYGDSSGKGNELTLMRASYNEYEEIAAFENEKLKKEATGEKGSFFDYLVLTAGTGMTISGLAAAMQDAGSSAGLVGISAARERERELDVIRENLGKFSEGSSISENYGAGKVTAENNCEASEMPKEPGGGYKLPEIRDDYLCGGYGKYDKDIEAVIKEAVEAHAVPLDPTYTGKTFYGMLKEIEAGRISGNVLFIHTGGYPIYMDYVNK